MLYRRLLIPCQRISLFYSNKSLQLFTCHKFDQNGFHRMIHNEKQLRRRLCQDIEEEINEVENEASRRWPLIKSLAAIVLGTYFGAVCAKLSATLLDEYGIFDPDDDDD